MWPPPAPAPCPDVPSRFCTSQVGRGALTLGLTSPLPLPAGPHSRAARRWAEPAVGQGVVLVGTGAQAGWWEGPLGAAGSNTRPSAGRLFQAVSTVATDLVPGNHPEVRSLRRGCRHGAWTHRDVAALNFTECREVINSKYAAEPGALNRHSGCGRGLQCLGVRREPHMRRARWHWPGHRREGQWPCQHAAITQHPVQRAATVEWRRQGQDVEGEGLADAA